VDCDERWPGRAAEVAARVGVAKKLSVASPNRRNDTLRGIRVAEPKREPRSPGWSEAVGCTQVATVSRNSTAGMK
jgi:hypothetical protein